MNTRTRIPPPGQRQQQLERQRRLYEQKKREIQRRKRNLLIKRISFFVVIAVIAVLLVWVIMSFIDLNSKNHSENNGDIVPAETPEENNEEGIEEGHSSEFDLSTLIDPSTLNPNDKIDLYYRIDQVLPTVYESANAHYNTFAQDNPVLGSNKDTRIIVIDAGHQDDTRKSNVWLSPYVDPSKSSSWVYNSLLTIGTEGTKTKIPEYETTHLIADKLKAALEASGYKVLLSHPDVKEQISGAERAAVANKNNADLMISLHCNSYDPDPKQSGALVLVPKIWDGYPSERLEYLSKHAATVILEEYTKETGLKNRGIDPIIKSSMFAFCKVPIILLEMGFSSCPSDDRNMNDAEFQKKMVDGIVNGINKYFSLIEMD